MKNTINTKSPINSDNSLKEFMTCKDYTVSKKYFYLYKDLKSDLLITNPQPERKDLGKYYQSDDYISHTDSKKSFFDKIYQIAKNYAINKKIQLVNTLTHSSQVKILDIGCGTGDFLEACSKQNYDVVGVEPNQKAHSLATKKLESNTSSSKLYIDINEIDSHSKFDVITMWHVLEHVPDLNNYILQLKNLLKENGTLIIAVPNYKSYDAKYYKQFWAAYDVPRHLWHFSQKAVHFLFDKINMKATKIIPMKLDAYYVSLLSEKYKTGKSNPFKAFYLGFMSNWKAKQSGDYSSLIYIIKNSKN